MMLLVDCLIRNTMWHTHPWVMAHLRVFNVCSQQLMPGEIMAIMQVLLLSPMKESLSTWVSLEARKGRWAPLRPRARMHSFRASRDLLISAPSIPGKTTIHCNTHTNSSYREWLLGTLHEETEQSWWSVDIRENSPIHFFSTIQA